MLPSPSITTPRTSTSCGTTNLANRIVSCGVPSTQHSYVDPPPGAKCQAQVTSPWNVTVYFDRPFVPGKALFFPIIPRSQWFGIALDAAQYRYDNCPTSTPPGKKSAFQIGRAHV